MALERIGSFEAAGDDTTAAVIRQAGSNAQKAVDSRVEPIAAGIIAQDSTVKAAAAAAVSTALDVSPRIPKLGDPGAWVVEDRNGTVAFSISSTGAIYAPTLNGAAAGPQRVFVIYGAGQSNMEGRAQPFSATLDPVDPNLMMWNWSTSALTTATVPLSSQQAQSGLSILTVMGREALRELPSNTVVIVVNAGVGSSPLVGSNSTGTWNPSGTATPNLYNIFVSTIASVRSAIAARFPGLPVTEVMAWHQGEADTTRDNYATVWDALCDGVRSATNNPSLPIVLGGIVPEYIVAQPTRALVREAHIGTPARKTFTAYQDGISNGGGSGSTTDIVHYAREGATRLGKAMWQGLKRAMSNSSTSVPVPPQTITATRVNGAVTVTWDQPMCRVTDYTVDRSTDGGTSWTNVSRAIPLETKATFTSAASAVLVRIATVNENGTSAYSTPVPVIGV